jgi:glycosyltransferase involved in cell wall biosynthesis
MGSPKISVVTACYNSIGYVGRLHASLCRQTFRDFEWVAVDDGSSDQSRQLLVSMSSPGLGGMRLYALPQNSGGGVAVGYGVERSVGDILVIVDHDDELEDFALQTIADEWAVVGERDDLAGLFFRRSNPSTGMAIGGHLQEGVEFSTSWLGNIKPEITDGVYALRRKFASKWFNARALESICLFGVPLAQMTTELKLRAGSSRPILRYYRDNPQSQTNSVKVSRKTVFTYAQYLNLWDRYYWRRPLYWLRHAVALGRFSLVVHGSVWFQLRFLSSCLLKGLAVALSPLVLLRSAVGRPLETRDYGEFDFSRLDELTDLRSQSAGGAVSL